MSNPYSGKGKARLVGIQPELRNEQLLLFHKLWCDEIVIWVSFWPCNEKEEFRLFALN